MEFLAGGGDDVVAQEGREFVSDPRQYGPDWLDEATGVVLVLVVVGAALWLARPLLAIGANITEA